MKPRTQNNGSNWRLDGDTITVFIPMTWKRRGGQKVIIAPDGGDAWAPPKSRPDETLIRALARTHRWKRMLDAGKRRSIAEIAEVEKIDRSFVSRLLRLTLLAPDIQEAILKGWQAKGMQLEELTGAMPGVWEGQPVRGGSSNRTLADFIGHLSQRCKQSAPIWVDSPFGAQYAAPREPHRERRHGHILRNDA